MAMVYEIPHPATQTPEMSLEYVGAAVYLVFYDAMGDEVVPTGTPRVERQRIDRPDTWVEVGKFAADEWRFNSPCARLRLNLAGVGGFATYRAFVWRTQQSLDLAPESVFSGMRAVTMQGYIEANVKNGVQFSASTFLTALTANENIDIIVITGAKKVLVKAQYLALKNSGDILMDWYRNPTYTGGANISAGIFNQSDVAPQPTTMQLIGVTPTDPAAGNYTPNDATKPNVTNVGTKILPTIAVLGTTGIGGSAQSRGAIEGLEQVLEANTAYLFRRRPLAATESMFGFSTWFEGEPDFPV